MVIASEPLSSPFTRSVIVRAREECNCVFFLFVFFSPYFCFVVCVCVHLCFPCFSLYCLAFFFLPPFFSFWFLGPFFSVVLFGLLYSKKKIACGRTRAECNCVWAITDRVKCGSHTCEAYSRCGWTSDTYRCKIVIGLLMFFSKIAVY